MRKSAHLTDHSNSKDTYHALHGDDTTLMAESEEELKSFLDESERGE